LVLIEFGRLGPDPEGQKGPYRKEKREKVFLDPDPQLVLIEFGRLGPDPEGQKGSYRKEKREKVFLLDVLF
jgi:hypothetical protein